MMNFQFVQYAPLLVLRSLYYPIQDIFGSYLCYYINHMEVFIMFLSQCQSFFITIFRYICLFHSQSLINLELTPKTLAKITVNCLFIVSLLTSSFIIWGSEPTTTLQSCLGNYVLLYERKGNKICSQGHPITNLICQLSYATYMILSSNLVESFLLYKCFRKIQKQTENVQSMIDQESYYRRRRDNGIVIRISILQWCVEMANLVFYFVYVTFFLGWSSQVDKFFNVYNVAFVMIVQPGFYVCADSNFRAVLTKYGVLYAVNNFFRK